MCEKTALKGINGLFGLDYPHIKILIIIPSNNTVTIVPTALVDSSKKLSDIMYIFYKNK